MGRIVRCGANIPPPEAQVDWGHPLAQMLSFTFWGPGRSGFAYVGGVRRPVSVPDVVPGVEFGGANSEWSCYVLGRYTGGVQYHFDTLVPRYLSYAGAPADSVYASGTRLYPVGYYAPVGWDSFASSSAPNSHVLYLNGAQIATSSVSATTPFVIGTLYVGQRYTLVEQWQAELTALHLYNRTLSAHEVAWLHNEPYAMFYFERPRTWFVLGTGFGVWRRPRARILGGGFVQ